MNIQPNDIIYFYLGAKFQFKWNDDNEIRYGKLASVFHDNSMLFPEPIDGKGDFEICDYRKDGELKLILVHPSDMTTHEKKAYYSLCQPRYWSGRKWVADTPQSLHYLFTRHIDAFNLIDNKLAINANWYSEPNILNIPADPLLIPEPDVDYDNVEVEMFTALKDEKPYEFYIHPKDKKI